MDLKILASSSSGNCSFVRHRSGLLLDCGIPIRDIRAGVGFGVSGLAGCLITHEHKDHSRAAKDLMRASVDLYMSGGTKDALGLEGHRVNVVRAKQQFSVGSWSVLPFDAVHDAAEPMGFLLACDRVKMLYLMDTGFSRYRFAGLTHILVEVNYSYELLRDKQMETNTKQRIMRYHFSLENVKKFLQECDLDSVQQIWLMHLSDDNSDAARFKREIQALTGREVHVAERRAGNL